MSGRSTADIVDDLREWDDPEDLIHAEAADRLVELDVTVNQYAGLSAFRAVVQEASRVLALRPPCPTCGGTTGEATVLLCGACGQTEPVGYDGTCCTWPMMLVSATDPRVVALTSPCPDCVDGKVSIEQLVKLWTIAPDGWIRQAMQ